MSSFLPRIQFPELFFGFVAPIGANLDGPVQSFREVLQQFGYRVEDIKVTDIFNVLKLYIKPDEALVQSPLEKRYLTHIAYGNQLRRKYEDDSLLAAAAVGTIIRKRNALAKNNSDTPFEKTAYLLHQFKRKEEIELLRSVYGRLFFQISVYSRRGSRVDSLARKFAASQNSAHPEKFRSKAEEIVQKDEDEVGEDHGQRVAKIFHDADFIATLDNVEQSTLEQIRRFLEILFSSNAHSPTKLEYGMFSAKAAALRTLDLSRQVGAAIFSCDGEIVSLGSNEVPKGGGGTYWSDGAVDARDYTRGLDSNDRRKKQLLSELLQILDYGEEIDSVVRRKDVKESQFMDALEYGRIVHAEMSAICDAARLGRQTKSTTLFCTTFPCHMCAKHIAAAGISKVIFLEPYPKSLASDLHSDSLMIENGDRGEFASYPSVEFEHFFGLTPRRYRELFERHSRKDSEGNFLRYSGGQAQPHMDIKAPFYTMLEKDVLKGFLALISRAEREIFGE